MSALLKKPRKWNVKPGLVAPEWRWFWKNDEGTWPFWDGAGTTAYDAGEKGRNATLVGANVSWDTSPLGRVVLHSGANDSYIDLGDAAQFPMGATSGQPFTFAGLFTHPSAPTTTNFGWFDGTRAFQQQVTIAEWRILYGISPFDILAGDSLVENTPRTFIVTFSSSGVGKFYVDGRLVATDASPTGAFVPSGVNFLVGARGTTGGGADGAINMKTHMFVVRSVEWNAAQVSLWHRDSFGPIRMDDAVGVVVVSSAPAAPELDWFQALSHPAPLPEWRSPTVEVRYPGVIQEARPASDVSGNWTPSSGSDSFEMINEVAPDDSDFIRSPENPTSNAEDVLMSNVVPVVVDDNHVVHYRYRKEPADGPPIDLTVTLLDGVTTIATFTHTNISGTVRMEHQPLTLAEAANITNYANLRLRFTADQP